jgi:hypothetical protein
MIDRSGDPVSTSAPIGLNLRDSINRSSDGFEQS